MGDDTIHRDAVTLKRGRQWMRLLDLGPKVIAQRFDGDPSHGGRYLGVVTYPGADIEATAVRYEGRGFTRAESTPTDAAAPRDGD